jgi:4'-phosphopantetheinyl transferase
VPDARRSRIWWADTDWLRDRHLTVLDGAEAGRRTEFRHSADWRRFALGAVLLRLATARQLGSPPRSVPVDRTCPDCDRPHGRPWLPGVGLHVSVSHSGRLVVVATTRGGPIGVDVQEITDIDHRPLVDDVLAPGEPRVRSRQDFFTYWVRKESALKATGEGLRTALNAVRTTAPDAPPELLSYRGAPLRASMTDLRLATRYAAAVTVLTPDPVAAEIRSAAVLLR